MTLSEYNAALDEIESMKHYGQSFLEEAEKKRKETITRARAFIREYMVREAGLGAKLDHIAQMELVAISTALTAIEMKEKPK